MTDEHKEQIGVILKLCVAVLCATLYAYGGMEGTWIRRYCMPTIFTAFCLVWNKSCKHIFILPFMILALSLGYGGTDLVWLKILKRLLYGTATAFSFGFFMILLRRWALFAYHAALVICSYIILGVWNITQSARVEETVLGLFVVLIPLMSLKREEQ